MDETEDRVKVHEKNTEFNDVERCALEDALGIEPESPTEELFMLCALPLPHFMELRRLFSGSTGRLVAVMSKEDKAVIAYVAREHIARLSRLEQNEAGPCGHTPRQHIESLENILEKLGILRYNA